MSGRKTTINMTEDLRPSASIAYSVGKALFLREAVSRLAAGRAAWLWMLLEPVVHVAFIMALFTFVRARVVPGAEFAIWLLTGLVTFFTARDAATRSMEAIKANKALFAYRQVLPVDTVLTRSAVEGFLGLIVALLLLCASGLAGFEVIPHDALRVLLAFAGMWLCGLGLGLNLSVAAELVPELGKLAKLMFLPLYFLSGVIFPLAHVPQQYRDWLFYNPFAHGVELVRSGFFPLYHKAAEADLNYLYGFALVLVFFGLALHVRFTTRLMAQ
jgi:capsular polysaccharide transport system permease protein